MADHTTQLRRVPIWVQHKQLGWIAALAAIMALAAALRLPGLADTVLSNDEAYAWRVTQYSLADWLYRTRHDASPPFSYLVLQGWQQLCGSSPWALRGLSVLLAVLTVPISYGVCIAALKLGRAREDAVRSSWRGGALLSAFLVAVHASQVVQGKNARTPARRACRTCGCAATFPSAKRGTSSTSRPCAEKTSSSPTRPKTRPSASGKHRRAAPMRRPERSRSWKRPFATV
jgi:hypothetical protein